jgi:hypothetical protein
MAVNNIIKIAVYTVLLVLSCLFFHGFHKNYNRLMNTTADIDEAANKVNIVAHQLPSSAKFSNIIMYGGAFFGTVLILGLLAGREVSNYVGHRFGKFLFNEEGEGFKDTDYEIAEQKWVDGNHLEAIELMRGYLLKNPNEQHVAIRIAEIYEKDLHNPLASALEYEEVLKQKLSAEQWGWTAIHLCNLYLSKLNKPKKASDLLTRIVEEYPETAAAEKARKRLETEAENPSVEESAQLTPQVAETPAPAPPKKVETPDNSELQNILNKLHQAKIRSSTDKES